MEVDKAKVLSSSLDKIELVYIKARLDIDAVAKSATRKNDISEIIDKASKIISDTMVDGMKKLSALVDVEYFDILPQIFGDDEATKSVGGQKIVKEATAIYDKGESIFAIFLELSKK